jgi:pilus assembly protein CpaE
MQPDYLGIALLRGTSVQHPEINKILEAMPKVKMLSQSSDPQRFIAQTKSAPPDVVLVDIREETKIPLWIEQLIQGLPQTPILVCSDHPNADFIIQAMQMGIKEVLPLPLSLTDLEAALNRVRMTLPRLQPADERKPGQVLVVTGHKGGVGCTSVAINLAAALSDLTAARVALIDLGRPFPDIANFLNQKPNYSFADLIDYPYKLDRSFVQSIMQSYENKLAIFHGIAGLRDQEDILEVIDHLFPILRDMYKYIVVDLGYWLDEFFIQVCTEADMVLILTQSTIPEVKNLKLFMSMLQEWELEKSKIKIVVNRYISRHVVRLGDLTQITKCPAFHTLPSDYFSLVKATDLGTILASAAPRSKLLKGINKLGTLILKEIGLGRHLPLGQCRADLLSLAENGGLKTKWGADYLPSTPLREVS